MTELQHPPTPGAGLVRRLRLWFWAPPRPLVPAPGPDILSDGLRRDIGLEPGPVQVSIRTELDALRFSG